MGGGFSQFDANVVPCGAAVYYFLDSIIWTAFWNRNSDDPHHRADNDNTFENKPLSGEIKVDARASPDVTSWWHVYTVLIARVLSWCDCAVAFHFAPPKYNINDNLRHNTEPWNRGANGCRLQFSVKSTQQLVVINVSDFPLMITWQTCCGLISGGCKNLCRGVSRAHPHTHTSHNERHNKERKWKCASLRARGVRPRCWCVN